ncbi:hypothetical protein [Sulfuriflexus mobilis]|uniref:hypothetical protein n=1 Tax=Sulfuriflexus mobilis TaxID=1811807 RepID=UPI000F82D17B|nr:hypothetical protein [Sulfuriflexus mobilis]
MKQTLLVLLVAIGLAGCITAPENTSGRVVMHGDRASVDIRFNDHDRRLIHDYYSKHRKKAKRTPPGLAKRGGNLPPGLAKRERLPPGLQGRGLPESLESSLSPLPGDFVRVKVGTDIVLMNRNTRVVFDILYGVD